MSGSVHVATHNIRFSTANDHFGGQPVSVAISKICVCSLYIYDCMALLYTYRLLCNSADSTRQPSINS